MKNIKRFSFSLLTAFLVLTIAALSASHVAMMRQLQQARDEVRAARAELETVRKEYGYIRADDPSRIYVSRIEGSESRGKSYRMRIPPGRRFMLNITAALWRLCLVVQPVTAHTVRRNGLLDQNPWGNK